MPKPDLRKSLGRQGEQLAEKWLRKRGYRLVRRNYTLTGGQIDLVMYFPQGNLVFVEVKIRRPARRPPPTSNRPADKPLTVEHRIGHLQLQALRRAAARFLAENPFPFADWQLDLVWISLQDNDTTKFSNHSQKRTIVAKIRHYKNVLEV